MAKNKKYEERYDLMAGEVFQPCLTALVYPVENTPHKWRVIPRGRVVWKLGNAVWPALNPHKEKGRRRMTTPCTYVNIGGVAR